MTIKKGAQKVEFIQGNVTDLEPFTRSLIRQGMYIDNIIVLSKTHWAVFYHEIKEK